jgi:VanZ family protein
VTGGTPLRASPQLRVSPLARSLLAVYVVLVVYASLYPFAGWREPGAPALGFLLAPWPRYVTAFDVAANFFGYLPYGLLCVLALRSRLAAGAAIGAAALTGAALSLALEAGQSFLPARIPSNLDVLANLAGALCGALLGARLAPGLLGGGVLQRFRQSAFAPGVGADLGLTLLGLWLFAQLNPATLLFGAGDLRDLLAGDAGPLRGAQLFVSIEASVAAANLAAVALLASGMTRAGAARWQAPALFGALLAAALLVKTLAFVLLMRAENPLAWLTRGAQLGLVAGAALALAALALPRALRLMIAAVLLMTATVLVNLAPPNPYFAAILKVWEQGHFLNFNGLTRVVGSLWPFIALGYLIWLATQRQNSAR